MKTIYKSEVKITKEFLDNVGFSKDHIEKDFIIKFLTEMPFDKLKELVNFKEIDYKDKELWGNAREDRYLYEKLLYLREIKSIEFNASVTI